MNFSALNEARAKVAAAREAITKDNEALKEIENQIAVLQARIESLRQRQESKGLRGQLEIAQREQAVVEETVLDTLNLNLAGEIIRRQASDPLPHSDWIMRSLVRLRDSVRSELDVPVNRKFSQHPLLTQALALLPPVDDLDKKVFDLGYTVTGFTDWGTRRRQIIAAAEAESTEPLEAA